MGVAIIDPKPYTLIRWSRRTQRASRKPTPTTPRRTASRRALGPTFRPAVATLRYIYPLYRKVDRCKATWKRECRLPWREAGPPNHHDDKVDSVSWPSSLTPPSVTSDARSRERDLY